MKTSNFLFALDFGTHEFSNRNHIVNFIKYLFSQSKQHQPNSDTIKNFITDRTDPSNPREYWNVNPADNSKQFLSDNSQFKAGWYDYIDDGAYVIFVIQVDGVAYSNLLSRKEQSTNKLKIDSHLYEDALEHLGKEELDRQIWDALKDSSDLIPFDIAPPQARAEIEKICLGALDTTMQGTTLLATSHNDQTDHNQHYHIHRLRKRLPTEVATVTQNEIHERKKYFGYK